MNDRQRSEIHRQALRWLGRGADTLDESEVRVLAKAHQRAVVARDRNEVLDGSQTVGARLADKVATFGGSWTFIVLFCAVLVVWTASNAWLLSRPFDPYPFIFLNLILSMVAALQAPIIMMSQNRQALKDRKGAELDYEVNLKAEIEIMALHDKLDAIRDSQIMAVLAKQEEQIALLTKVLADRSSSPQTAT